MAILINGSITFEIDNDLPFLCFECGEQFPTSHKLNIHSQSHTTVDGLYNIQKEGHGYYKCPKCILVFGKENDVEEHLYTRHNVDVFLGHTIYRTIENSLKCSEPTSLYPVVPSSQIIIQKQQPPPPIRVSVVQSLAPLLNDNDLAESPPKFPGKQPGQLPVIRGLSAKTLQRIPANVIKSPMLNLSPSKGPVNNLCFECGRGYATPRELDNHSCIDGSVKKVEYACSVCKQLFEKCEDLRAHEDSHKKIIRPYKCGLCGIDFSTANNLEIHIEWHSAENDVGDQQNEEEENISPEFMTAKKEQKQQTEQCDEEDPLDGPTIIEDSDEDDIVQGFKCEKCDVTFGSLKFLKTHVCVVDETHQVEKQLFKCNECNVTFDKKEFLIEHIESIHKEEEEEDEEEEEVVTPNRSLRSKGPAFRCTICKKGFLTKTQLDAHILQIHKVCGICTAKFDDPKEQAIHVFEEHDDEVLKRYCKICNKYYKTLLKINIHKEYYHSKEPHKYCELCDISFCLASAKDGHDNFFHGPQNVPVVPKYYTQCDVCGRLIKGFRQLQTHRLTHDKGVPDISSDEEEPTLTFGEIIKPVKSKKVEDIPLKEENVLECKECGKECRSSSGLQNHIRRMHGDIAENDEEEETVESEGENSLECKECGKECKSSSGLRNHIRRIHGDTIEDAELSNEEEVDDSLECKECAKKCLTAAGLKKHMLWVHRDKAEDDEMSEGEQTENKYQCNECGKQLNSSNGLYTHIRIVHNMQYYTCDDCGKVFTNATSFELHKTHHDRTRKEQGSESSFCKTCKKVFMTKHGFEAHAKTHLKRTETPESKAPSRRSETSETSPKRKRIECPLCRQIFKSDEVFKTHKKIDHANEQYCFICQRSFEYKSRLKTHFIRHHKEEKIHYESSEEEAEAESRECKLCGDKKISDLFDHLQNIHNIKNTSIINKEIEGIGELENLQALKCPLCYKEYLMKYNLRRHIKEHHGVSKDEKLNYIVDLWKVPRECKFCNETINEDFNAHLQNYHKIRDEDILDGKEIKFYDDGHCSLCDHELYTNRARLYDHVRHSHKVTNTELRSQLSQVKLDEKLKIKHESYRASPDISKTKPESTRRRSVKTKEEKENILCKLCDNKEVEDLEDHFEAFHRISDKAAIKYIISDEKTALEPLQITCFLCGKTGFLTLVHMRRHLNNSHLVKNEIERRKLESMWREKEAPSFECEVCKDSFPTESTLKRHKANHDVVIKHICQKCDVEFDSVYDLLRHEKRHEKGQECYSCTMCSKKFTCGKDLNSHLKSHIPMVKVTPFPIEEASSLNDTPKDQQLMEVEEPSTSSSSSPTKNIEIEISKNEKIDDINEPEAAHLSLENIDRKPLDSLLFGAVVGSKSPNKTEEPMTKSM